MNACASLGLSRLIWARTLFWNAPNCPTAELKLPRSNDAAAAFNEAISGRLFFRTTLALSTSATHCSTASEGEITHNRSVVLQLSRPSETVNTKVWQPSN